MPALPERRFQRFTLNVPCAVRPLRKYAGIKVQPISAETKDISRGGICIVANAAWKVGTEIECVLQLAVEPLPAKPVEIQRRGKIVRVAERENGGLELGATIEHFSYPDPKKDQEEE
jgi:c-di-GMP-binding flagellar brake protein YcgR